VKTITIRMLLAVAALALSGAGQAAPPPAEAFGRLPLLSDADLSPSGDRIVTIANVDGESVVAVLDTRGGPWKPVLKGETRDVSTLRLFRVSWCRFKTDQRILCGFRSDYIDDWARLIVSTRLVALDADGRNNRELMVRGGAGTRSQFADRIVSMLEDDPTGVLVEVDEDHNGYPSVLRVDVNTGLTRPHTGGLKPIREFYADPGGNVRLASGYVGTNISWFVRDGKGRPWRELERYRAFSGDSVAFVGFGVRPNELYVRRSHEGREALWLVDLDDRENPKLLFSHPSVDVDGPVMWNDRLVGVAYDGERPEIYFVDADARSLFAMLKRILPGTVPEILDQTKDGNRLLVRAQADRQPPLYLLVDRTSGKASVLANAYPDLAATGLAAMNAITYPARDGTRIPGYLTLPPGAKPENLPLVVMPHGGPIARDVWGFDFLQQFLVSRGYAVLQMEFRGSAGYGDAWFAAAHQDWGGLTYDDVVDGVRWAIQRKVADPRRIAIVGWSFGGYVALLGATRDADLYRCVVSIAGISDLGRLLSFQSNYVNSSIAREQIGTERDALRDNSPRRLVEGVRIPVLMFHGTLDVQAPVSQSRLMSAALARAGKPHELVEYENESHQMDHGGNRTDMLKRIETFLAAHLGDATAPAAGPAAAASDAAVQGKR